jgi:hypothetical protein
MEGLAQKADDLPREGEAKRTIIILAELEAGQSPENGDKIYFELPAALGKVQTMRAEVHIYLFDHLPPSPIEALLRLDEASATVWCKIIGLEDDQGGAELDADWFIDNRRHPKLKRTRKPFRPKPAPDMQQVRVEAYNKIFDEFEYLFEPKRGKWEPMFDTESTIDVSGTGREALQRINLIPPEHLEWFWVKGLRPSEGDEPEAVRQAITETSPESGSFILLSYRRRKR